MGGNEAEGVGARKHIQLEFSRKSRWVIEFLGYKHDICKRTTIFAIIYRPGMIKKTHLFTLMFVVLCVFSDRQVSAQYLAPRFSIHLSNPLTLGSKIGVKLQYRLSLHHAVLAGYRKYWGFFPGYQYALEYHHYYRTWERSEAFYYGKAGIGNADYAPKPYFSGWETQYNRPAGYVFIGAGLGKRYNFGPFFIEGYAGLKYAGTVEKTEGYNRNLFYTLGPASFVDAGFTLGLQFFNEERNMYRRTLGAHRPRMYR